jgi:hypothetical protein
MKKTLVLGASPNPDRYANRAVKKLKMYGHEVIAVGRKPAGIDDTQILQKIPREENIDTITVYLNAENQKQYYTDIISLHPHRIIFNPGAENPELEELAQKNNIETMEACTLVLLSTGQF